MSVHKNHRVIKQAFSSYGYIRPEYSQLYLNEFCFYRNLKVFGLDALVAKWREKIGVVEEEKGGKSESGLYSSFQLKSKSGMEAVAVSFSSELETRIQTYVRIVKKKLPLLDLAAELFLNCISGCI